MPAKRDELGVSGRAPLVCVTKYDLLGSLARRARDQDTAPKRSSWQIVVYPPAGEPIAGCLVALGSSATAGSKSFVKGPYRQREPTAWKFIRMSDLV
jgi:hypothetical protein